MKCPDCHRPLPSQATICPRCQWNAQLAPLPIPAHPVYSVLPVPLTPEQQRQLLFQIAMSGIVIVVSASGFRGLLRGEIFSFMTLGALIGIAIGLYLLIPLLREYKAGVALSTRARLERKWFRPYKQRKHYYAQFTGVGELGLPRDIYAQLHEGQLYQVTYRSSCSMLWSCEPIWFDVATGQTLPLHQQSVSSSP